ncbi:MAG: squalene/phytoene synthase family protein [Tagaea sp.]|nr:squalene/phytoene synthase family protein [Tagaea sp.]
MSDAALSEADRSLRAADPERWRTTLFAGGADRARLVSIYAFNLEIARVRETVSEPMLGQIRLQWWREALDEIAAGGPVRKHLIVEALAATRPDFAALRDAIDARERDLDDAPYADLAEMERYARGAGGSIARAAFGEFHAASEPIGTAYALAGMLRALPFFARQRRTPLPADLMAQAGLEPDAIHENKAGDALRGVVEPVARRAQALLDQARARDVPKPLFAAALPGKVAALALRRLERARFDPFAAELQKPHPADIWRLWWAHSLRRF